MKYCFKSHPFEVENKNIKTLIILKSFFFSLQVKLEHFEHLFIGKGSFTRTVSVSVSVSILQEDGLSSFTQW